MSPLNNILNRVDGLSHQDSLLKSAFCSRATNLFITTPVEVLSVAQNVLLAPVQAASTILKFGAKTIAYISNSQAIRNFEAKLPGFTDLLRTIARVVAYTIGAALTATVGFVSPRANFAIHCAFGLATNNRKEAILAAQELEKAKEEQRDYEEILRVLEAEELNNLEIAFNAVNQAEQEIEDSVVEHVAPLFHAAETEIAEIEARAQQEAKAASSLVGRAINGTVNTSKAIVSSAYNTSATVVSSAYNNGKSLVSGTFNVVTHPVQTTKNVYNYVTGYFVAQKA